MNTPRTIESTLNAIKIAHTIVWAAFVACIVAIWLFAWHAEFYYATLLINSGTLNWMMPVSQDGQTSSTYLRFPPQFRGCRTFLATSRGSPLRIRQHPT